MLWVLAGLQVIAVGCIILAVLSIPREEEDESDECLYDDGERYD